jgi:predicted  nucleic acid-binding Zn-ribbon protein
MSIHTKLRSMPRSKAPSAIYIQMHQLANQRERLQDELKRLGDRSTEVYKQLQELEVSLNQLESEATQYNLAFEPLASTPKPTALISHQTQTNNQNSQYKSFVIEY